MTQEYALQLFKKQFPLYKFCNAGRLNISGGTGIDIIIETDGYIIQAQKLSEHIWKIAFDKDGVNANKMANIFSYDSENDKVLPE
jgi:hypothetical protein